MLLTLKPPVHLDLLADATNRIFTDTEDIVYNPDLEYQIGESLWMDVLIS